MKIITVKTTKAMIEIGILLLLKLWNQNLNQDPTLLL
jgi:hypothetical protein